MFEQSLVVSSHGHKLAAEAASLGMQIAAVAALAVVPLLHPALLQAPRASSPLVTELPAYRPAPAPAVTAARPHFTRFAPPAPITFVPPAPAPVTRALPAPLPPAILPPGGLVGSAPAPPALLAPAPLAVVPLPAVPKPAPPERVAVGGQVQAARCLACPPPEYPAIARQLHLAGTVELHALIAADGRVRSVATVSGNAMLAA